MNDHTAGILVELNRRFYSEFALSFAETREHPQPGYDRLTPYFVQFNRPTVLDIGCGDGRFGRFLTTRGIVTNYVGLDFSSAMWSARENNTGRFVEADLSKAGCLDDLGEFNVIICLSTLQHIPSHRHRLRLLREIRDHLASSGFFIMANWQFLDSQRQRKKILPWDRAGLKDSDVEPEDYLLSWQRNGLGMRYVAYLDPRYTENLVKAAGFRIIGQYRCDGRENNLNLYTIMGV